MSQATKQRTLQRLQTVLKQMPELQQFRLDSPPFKKWQRDARVAIANTFDSRPNYPQDFDRQFLPWLNGHSDADVRESVKALLDSMISEINEYWKDDEASRSSDNHGDEWTKTKEIFIVHGRDDSAREIVARFLERLELNPVVLHEKPSQGRTIIDKFEEYARAGFAVILLTPDDEGRLRGNQGDLKPRARQNVILELGYFLGKLGRQRVCALVKIGIETPSDYDGVVYIELDDSGGWKMKLFQELKSVGYDVNANRVSAT